MPGRRENRASVNDMRTQHLSPEQSNQFNEFYRYLSKHTAYSIEPRTDQFQHFAGKGEFMTPCLDITA